MKLLPLGLLVAIGLFGIGCGEEPVEEGAPPEAEVTRVASSLERKLTVLIAIPADTAIGQSIDALVEARSETLAPQPFPKVGENGQKCMTVRFNDDQGVEQMRRERCGKTADTLRIGKVTYMDHDGDGKIDELEDTTQATYQLFDEDRDGKVDRIVESAERIAAPIALNDFAENVTITAGGKIASRIREDKDHDGKFDLELVTATTSFRITTPAAPATPAP